MGKLSHKKSNLTSKKILRIYNYQIHVHKKIYILSILDIGKMYINKVTKKKNSNNIELTFCPLFN